MRYKESRLAHLFLDGLSGLEIGGSAHNSFGLDTKNVDYTNKMDTIYKIEEIKWCGEAMPVDVIAPGDKLPFPNKSQDFIISSHVLEHFPDPIKALKEWYRVIKEGGYIFMIIPHKNRMFDKNKKRTKLIELIARHNGSKEVSNNYEKHHSVWITEDILELIQYLGWRVVFYQDIDDKAENGFTVVIQKGVRSIDPSNVPNGSRSYLYDNFSCALRTEKDIELLVDSLKKKDDQIAIVNNKVASLNDKIASLNKQLKTANTNMELMKQSKFWKLRNEYLHIKHFASTKNRHRNLSEEV